MLQNKSTKILSEINNFFTSSEKAVFKTLELFKALNLSNIKLEIKDYKQATYKKSDILLILLLFPLFSVKNTNNLLKSKLGSYLNSKKDVYYRFKNNSFINWRSLLNIINKRLFKKISENCTSYNTLPRCLIVDDTDFRKSGFRIEHMGKIWSHVLHKGVLGFKGLFLGYWDGKSFFGIDFSLHKEKGNNQKKPFGLKRKQLKKQYKKTRDKTSCGNKREKELLKDKISNAIIMISRALNKNISVDYILMDSWFVCEKVIKFVKGLQQDIHLIGMLKNGTAKYEFEGKILTAKQIADILKRHKKVKKNKRLNMYVAETILIFKGIEIKVYFCKTSKRGKWHLLVSTDTSLGILRAYEIYSIRWSIEVFFKESKQYFGLGKSQSRDFDSQISDITINIIQYNIFSTAKRFTAYETLGELFREVQGNIQELTIGEKIWGFILELLHIVTDIFDSDFNELIIRILKTEQVNNKFINQLQYSLLKAA